MQRKKERQKEKKIPFIMATYVSSCSTRAAHAIRWVELGCDTTSEAHTLTSQYPSSLSGYYWPLLEFQFEIIVPLSGRLIKT
jgi:hypothetical protein